MFSNFFFENLAVYEKMSENVVERDAADDSLWLMRVACWISRATRARTRTSTQVTNYNT